MIVTLLRKRPQGSTLSSLPTGVLAIDASRIALAAEGEDKRLGGVGTWKSDFSGKNIYMGGYAGVAVGSSRLGRFPANVILISQPLILRSFPYTESGKASATGHVRNSDKTRGCYGAFVGQRCEGDVLYGDAGSASRFFKQVGVRSQSDVLLSQDKQVKGATEC